MKFEYLTVDNGLSNNYIKYLLRDSRGYLFIGTDLGLNVYDGQKIVVYKNSTSQANSISDNIITCIFEDKFQNLWIGTENGLNLFNRKTESFEHFFHRVNDKNSISDNFITKIIQDNEGNLWISTHNGLNKLDVKKKEFSNYFISNTKLSAYNKFFDICFDAFENIWLAASNDKIWNFTIHSGTFKAYPTPISNAPENLEKKIFVDLNGTLWLGTRGNGLYSYKIATNQFVKYSTNGDGTGTKGREICCILPDGNRYIMFACDHGGLNRLDIKTNKFDYFKNINKYEEGLNSEAIWSLFKDKENILYAGSTVNGLNIYNPNRYKFKTYRHSPNNSNSLVYDIVFKFFEDSHGLIWIGTDGGGLSVFNPITKNFTNYIHDQANPYSISGNAVLSIAEDKNHNIWIGTWGNGLNRFDRKTNKFYHFLPDVKNPKAILSDRIWDLYTDKKGNLWISYFNDGIDVFNIEEVVIKKYRPNAKDAGLYIDPVTNCISSQNDGNIGFATSGGYYLLDTISSSLIKQKIFKNNKLNDVYLDTKGNYWAGTTNEGLILVKKDGKAQTFNESNGFASNIILGILEDDRGNIWVLSLNTLSRYNNTTKQFQHFNVSDGLQGKQYTRLARLKSKDGTFYIGGYNGFNTFNPDEIKTSSYIPPVYIDEFQIFNEQVSINDPNSPLKQSISETKEIVLSYKQSVFSFGFTAVNFTSPENAIYAYKMEGYDKKWNYTTSNRRYATYTNLDPNEYTFMVKATNQDGIWNEKPTSIRIKITPPYWKSNWFIFLTLFLIIGSAFGFYKWRTSELKRQKRKLEINVKERTMDLEDANTQLEQRQEEILQQNEEIKLQKELVEEQHAKIEKAFQELSVYENHLENLVEERTNELETARLKAEESDKLKSSFLANLSHEIRTPLNAIVGFSNLLVQGSNMNPKDEMYKNLINSSSDTLLNLINDILDFSKIEAGQVDIVKKTFKLSELFYEIKNIFEFELSKIKHKTGKALDFRIQTTEGFENIVLFSDQTRIKQIFQNLISNAIKFTDRGYVDLKYELLPNKGLISFKVQDTGIGIEEEYQDIIFERFRKVESSSNRLFRGTGIGLSICQQLVKLLGGEISVESEPGKGSVFQFTIQHSFNNNIDNIENQSNINSSIPNFKGKIILVAEDDDSNYTLLEIYLKKTKAIVIWAKNGLEAFEIFKLNPEINLILMDIKMPVMDGFDSLKQIKEIDPQIVVLAQTAHAYHNEIDRIKSFGFNGYILKPIDSKNLYVLLQKYLEN